MALTPSWPGVTALATTTDARKDLAGLIVKDTAGVARSGIFPAHTNALVTARTDMNVDIAAFTGAAVQFGGPVLICNDGVAQLPAVLVSPGAGTNYYVIYAKQNESTAPGTDVNNNRVFGAQLSTTSLAVARAALPAGALELGTVEMPTGKTATNQSGVLITATFQYTAAAGATVLVRNSTERAAWTPATGARVKQLDTGVEYVRDGSAWADAGSAHHAGRSGSAVAGITIPGSAVPLPNGIIVKTGQLVAPTTVAFGNEYFPVVLYPTPFPTSTLHVSMTPISGSPITNATGNPIAIDTIDATQFRALIPSSPNPWVRGFTWIAYGY